MLVPILLLTLACGDKAGDETTEGTTEGTTAAASSSSSGAPTTGATTGPDATGGTETDGGSTGASTGVDSAAFERFELRSAAGPCPTDDCDGFIELQSSGLLRVEAFGEASVTEVEVSAEDLAAAAAVFADPALIALLDGEDPVCDPPDDIFESMLVVLDGATHDAATTDCGQPPIAAARAMAQSLRDAYVP